MLTERCSLTPDEPQSLVNVPSCHAPTGAPREVTELAYPIQVPECLAAPSLDRAFDALETLQCAPVEHAKLIRVIAGKHGRRYRGLTPEAREWSKEIQALLVCQASGKSRAGALAHLGVGPLHQVRHPTPLPRPLPADQGGQLQFPYLALSTDVIIDLPEHLVVVRAVLVHGFEQAPDYLVIIHRVILSDRDSLCWSVLTFVQRYGG